MTIICVDNTPIMLHSLKENAQNAYPSADVQTFLTEENARALLRTYSGAWMTKEEY